MDLARLLRHLATTSARVRRAFPASALHSIEQAIATSEASHAGEIRFVVEGSLDGLPLLRGQTARERAIELFAQLHVWDTVDNTGVLIYVLLADRRVEIVADRGIHAKAGAEAWSAIWASKWDLGLPTLVVVAVGGGYATVVEASALAAAYSILVEVLVFREIKPFRDLPGVLSSAATLVGSVVLLLGTALGLTSWFVDAEIPTLLVEWMTTHIKSPALFLLMLNGVLLVLGSVLEIYSAIVVLAPLVAPLGVAYGIEPIHLGVVFLANLELGFLFPPMGLNLFLSAQRFQKPLPQIYRNAFPFLIIMSAGVLAITYLPILTTGVVQLFGR